MNRYKLISVTALLILVIALPAYVLTEPDRMAQAQIELRQEYVSDAAVMYIENCAVCHGAAGEGIGAIPGLDNSALWTADYNFLFKTIARGRFGTAMSGWHVDEGGIFNDYQIDELVALIRYVDWAQVRELAARQGLIPPTLPVPQVQAEFLDKIAALAPEGSSWAEGIELYANNCTICHGVNGEGSDLGVPLNTTELRTREADELERIIREGVTGTMMASWKNILSNDQIESLVTFLQNWDVIEGEGLVLEPPEPIRIDLDNPEELLSLGERIFNTTCVSCHGVDGSGGTGPALNSLQILTRNSDDQIMNTIINGGRRPNSSMPAFGDSLTSVELTAIVDYIRSWESSAIWVENPRGTQQGGGPPWLRATPDPNSSISPDGGGITGNAGGPSWRQTGQTSSDLTTPVIQGPAVHLSGEVISVEENLLNFQTSDGVVKDAMLGPPWFWSENGISLNVGDEIELDGFESTDHTEVNWLINHTTGQTITLRDSEGIPVWNSIE